jgi:uncharacterized protein YgiM (DUF1202 family)
MNYWRTILILGILIFFGISTVSAQNDAVCPAYVAAALEAVASACGDLERNQACYGNNQIIAEFWQETDDSRFSQPADRIVLAELRSLATTPLDIEANQWGVAALKVQANIPETLPGQAVTLLLMGDATLENAVTPDQVRAPVTPIPAQVSVHANLRSLPTTASNVVRSAEIGEILQIIGINKDGDWFEVAQETGLRTWIKSSLVSVSDANQLAGLPATDESIGANYAPMQAFYFRNGLSSSACREAPNMLAVQSPDNLTVTLKINSLEFSMGSTLLFTSAQLPDGTPVLVGTLVEGHFTVHYLAFAAEMTQPGQTFAVTLNADGQVDEDSQLVDLSSNSEVDGIIHNGCLSLMNNPLLPVSPPTCDFSLDYDVQPPAGGSGDLSNIGTGDTCTIAPDKMVNLRGGPGTNYAWNGQLQAGEQATPDGFATDSGGQTWWHLSNGLWVRSDLVNQAGACGGLPPITPPDPPATSAPPPPPSSGSPSVGGIFEIQHRCADLNAVRPGQTITFQDGIGRWPTPAEKDAALAGHSAVITVDGMSLSVYYEGTTLHVGDGGPDGYGDRARADWVATPGTHTVAGYWTSHGGTDSCTFTIAP